MGYTYYKTLPDKSTSTIKTAGKLNTTTWNDVSNPGSFSV